MSRSEVLVSTDWLADNADSADIRIIEVDEDTEAYAVGHIPGSIAWHWSNDLHDRPRRELISQDQVHALLARSGVGPETTVILWGGNNNWFAAYAYWTLRYRGFDRVKLLDGGRKKWEAENRPQTADVPGGAREPRPARPRTTRIARVPRRRAGQPRRRRHTPASMSAALPNIRGSSSLRHTCRRSRRRSRGTFPVRPTSRGRWRPGRTVPFGPTTSCVSSTATSASPRTSW